jgi:tetratricopeptide (TPR) repeat protein
VTTIRIFIFVFLLQGIALADSFEDNKEKAKKLRANASEYFNKGKYLEALKLFQQAYNENQEIRDRYNMGNCYLALEDYSQALDMYELYIKELEVYDKLLLDNRKGLNELIEPLQDPDLKGADKSKAESLLERINALFLKRERLLNPPPSETSKSPESPFIKIIKTNPRKLLIIPSGIFLGISGIYGITTGKLLAERNRSGETTIENDNKIRKLRNTSIISALPVVPLLALALYKKNKTTTLTASAPIGISISASKISLLIYF